MKDPLNKQKPKRKCYEKEFCWITFHIFTNSMIKITITTKKKIHIYLLSSKKRRLYGIILSLFKRKWGWIESKRTEKKQQQQKKVESEFSEYLFDMSQMYIWNSQSDQTNRDVIPFQQISHGRVLIKDLRFRHLKFYKEPVFLRIFFFLALIYIYSWSFVNLMNDKKKISRFSHIFMWVKKTHFANAEF